MLGFKADTLALWDDLNSRLTLVGPSDQVEKTVSTWFGEERQPRAFGLYDDGAVLIAEGRILSASAVTPGATWRDTLRLMRLNVESGARTELTTVESASWIWTGRMQLPLPFSTNASYLLEDEILHVAAGADFRIRAYSGGRLTEAFGVDRELRSVTESARNAWTAWLEQGVDSAGRAASTALLDHPMTPKSLPAYAQLLRSSSGEIWARVYSVDPLAAATWDVYSREREWQGQIQTPASFYGTAIDGDRLVGIWFDPLGVEYVRVYTIERAASPD
jgi:hypothetical protein